MRWFIGLGGGYVATVVEDGRGYLVAGCARPVVPCRGRTMLEMTANLGPLFHLGLYRGFVFSRALFVRRLEQGRVS